MNREQFRTRLQKWCLDDSLGKLGIEELKRDIEYLERELFHEYAVTAQGEHGPFGVRLARWVGNLALEADQKRLYRLLAHLFFIGQQEQIAAYRTAYSKHVMQWLMVERSIDAFDAGAKDRLEQELRATRFTEVTDSFGIRDFCLYNNIQTEALRPKWEGTIENWDANSFRANVLCEGHVVRVASALSLAH